MTAINATGGAAPTAVHRADEGMVTVGGVTLSPSDAAEFVMLHRTEVMKKVGADRTEMAQQHLERIKTARGYLTDIISLGKFNDQAKSYHGRVPVTPNMVNFLKQTVGCSPGEYVDRLEYYGSGVARLPESVQNYYGFNTGGHGTGGDFDIKEDNDDSTTNRFQVSGITVVHEGELDSIKEEVNNYIDQQNDSNNLFMTKFKSVVNSMNEALEGANSMADKSHETLKNLVSRW